MNIAIIPARKGSQRCPGKNTAEIAGQSLYQRAINKAIDSKEFDRIIVSTNDEIIIDYVENNSDVELDIREENLSNSTSTLIDVIRWAIVKKQITDESIICLLPVTNPLCSTEDIKGGMSLYHSQPNKNTIVSACEMDYPIELTWKYDETTNRLFNTHKINSTRKQDYNASFRWNDGFVIDSALAFKDLNRNNFGYNPTPYFMPPERSFYIDYPWQLEIIKLIMEKN